MILEFKERDFGNGKGSKWSIKEWNKMRSHNSSSRHRRAFIVIPRLMFSKAQRDMKFINAMYEEDYSSAMMEYDTFLRACLYDGKACKRDSWMVSVVVTITMCNYG